ncbi:lasso peptide biosynthesis protein [Bacillus swezeyi]|uniref:Microcin J25-processing protein McjB C-terminal domain-containing protein n=1 Tax=Bacillus swezeyi TaxID=1925020 RepID=A0A1R1RMT0_9BACI|nr:lasso peptide biosynthesis protein [Bacillus swezeyi]MEC1261273.1 lasso peptide biosynthesis protein [Bacillus swezeyi]MED2929256.1 lasso peptide biosynthesis protein [Bacillus swezeyi]MED2963717.1 lasso peptide biosynthesis protein [Bacillus swezeyi]MED3073577.1 lasso peptide biosynthesis protein [Bacillus swezeyi]MED3081837.1 lasso peptide biosynthesis protein [Bacillus swezeyi]
MLSANTIDITQCRYHALKVSDDQKLVDAYFTVFREFRNSAGSCHVSSAILFVILKELGYDAKLCLGVVRSGAFHFDHSWIEIDGKVYDSAINMGLQGVRMAEPVFADYYLESGQKMHDIEYGQEEGGTPDIGVATILKIGFVRYMDDAPRKNGLWSVVKKLGKEVHLKLNIQELRQKYRENQWIVKSKYTN